MGKKLKDCGWWTIHKMSPEEVIKLFFIFQNKQLGRELDNEEKEMWENVLSQYKNDYDNIEDAESYMMSNLLYDISTRYIKFYLNMAREFQIEEYGRIKDRLCFKGASYKER